MKISYKFQLLPTSFQVSYLEKMDRILTEFYNDIVKLSDGYYKETKKTLKYSVIAKTITTIKNDPSSKDFFIHTHIYQGIAKRFKRTRENSFRVFKETGIYHPPKLKETVGSFSLQDSVRGWKLVGNNKIKFNGIVIKFNKHREIIGDVIYPIIKREKDGKYYLILLSEISEEKAKSQFEESTKNKTNSLGIYSDTLKKVYAQNPSEHIGIDLGIKKFITSSDGFVFENPKFYKEFIGSILKYQKILDNKCKQNKSKKSKRYYKSLILMNKKFRKMVNKRNDYLHKVAKYLLINYKSVAVEDLHVANMLINKDDKKDFLQKLLHRELSNVAFGKFISILEMKSKNTKTLVLKVDPKNTTKACSFCGNMVEKDLSVRIHNCNNCGLSMDRDLNASINIFNKAWKKPSISSEA